MSVTVTLTLGATAPVGSLTMPETDAWKVCASAMPATKRTSERTIEVTFAERFIISPFLLESSLKFSLSGQERHMPLAITELLTEIIYQSGAGGFPCEPFMR